MFKKNNFKNRGFRPSNSGGSRFGGNRNSSFGNKDGGNRRSNPYNTENLKHDMYISKAEPVQTTQDDIYDTNVTFFDLGLHPRILRNITSRNYKNPTKIQSQTIPSILEKKDLLGLASTGSGKTGAFLIPVLSLLMSDTTKRCLIIAPTRELVNQIQGEYKIFAEGTSVRDALVIGGASYAPQIRLLSRNPQLVIATPGRLIDHYKSKKINFADFDIIVLDEVDQMLDMGFINDIKLIISNLKDTRQSLFFSATMSSKIRDVASNLLRNPITIEIAKQSAAKNVEQNIVKINNSKGKLETLHELLAGLEFDKVLVFAKTKRGADDLALALQNKGHKVDALHGDKSLGQRMRILSSFKKSEIEILIATDVASRGIDVPNISHVINYDEPATYADYIHRIGRTGRIGKKGVALTFVK
jgi:superfamily II DNA/RNA helicase